MPYRYEATEKFWAGFYDLKDSQKESVRQVWKIRRDLLLFPRDRFDESISGPQGFLHLLSLGLGWPRSPGPPRDGSSSIARLLQDPAFA